MSGLWQVCFALEREPQVFLEVLMAVLDAETASLHQEGDAGAGAGADESESGAWHAVVLMPYEPEADFLERAFIEAGEITSQSPPLFEVVPLAEKDWLAENRRDFAPMAIGSFWIYGSHHEGAVQSDKIGLCLDAGRAFGTGRHATTRGCILMLEKYAARFKSTARCRIADIGCGSGVLAMAAAKVLAGSRVVAVDNDRVAAQVAAENMRVNGVAAKVKTGFSEGYQSDLVQENAPYDLILANILAGPLRTLAGDASAAMAEGGILILSGLLEEQTGGVVAVHEREGLRLIETIVIDGWSTLVMTK